MGRYVADRIRAYGKPRAVLYDIKGMLLGDRVDGRL